MTVASQFRCVWSSALWTASLTNRGLLCIVGGTEDVVGDDVDAVLANGFASLADIDFFESAFRDFVPHAVIGRLHTQRQPADPLPLEKVQVRRLHRINPRIRPHAQLK